jgi:hypothetical protein
LRGACDVGAILHGVTIYVGGWLMTKKMRVSEGRIQWLALWGEAETPWMPNWTTHVLYNGRKGFFAQFLGSLA